MLGCHRFPQAERLLEGGQRVLRPTREELGEAEVGGVDRHLSCLGMIVLEELDGVAELLDRRNALEAVEEIVAEVAVQRAHATRPAAPGQRQAPAGSWCALAGNGSVLEPPTWPSPSTAVSSSALFARNRRLR